MTQGVPHDAEAHRVLRGVENGLLSSQPGVTECQHFDDHVGENQKVRGIKPLFMGFRPDREVNCAGCDDGTHADVFDGAVRQSRNRQYEAQNSHAENCGDEASH